MVSGYFVPTKSLENKNKTNKSRNTFWIEKIVNLARIIYRFDAYLNMIELAI